MNIPKLPYYHIKHLIAEGGTASIFWGIDLRSGYPVAIKELKIKHIKNKIIKDNFRNFETQLYVYLHYPKPHPNLPQLRDFIEIPETGQLYLVMDFIQGRDLERYIYNEIGLIPEQKALPMFLEILDTVAYLHNCKIPALGIKNGLLHLDIKPNNIMLLPDGKIKLIHKQMRKCVKERYLTNEETIKNYRNIIIDTLSLNISEFKESPKNEGRIEEYAYHLLKLGDKQTLEFFLEGPIVQKYFKKHHKRFL